MIMLLVVACLADGSLSLVTLLCCGSGGADTPEEVLHVSKHAAHCASYVGFGVWQNIPTYTRSKSVLRSVKGGRGGYNGCPHASRRSATKGCARIVQALG